MSLDVLSIGNADDQEECTDLVEMARDEVMQAPGDPKHLNVVVRIPPGDRDVALAFHVFPYVFRPKRNDAIRAIAQLVLDQSDRSRCLVVSRMTETWDDNGFDAITMAVAAKGALRTSCSSPKGDGGEPSSRSFSPYRSRPPSALRYVRI
jgi:hypothetical protein